MGSPTPPYKANIPRRSRPTIGTLLLQGENSGLATPRAADFECRTVCSSTILVDENIEGGQESLHSQNSD